MKVEGDVHAGTFLQFHLYGRPFEVANIKELLTKTQKVELSSKDDLKIQVEQIRPGVKTKVEQMKTVMKQMKQRLSR